MTAALPLPPLLRTRATLGLLVLFAFSSHQGLAAPLFTSRFEAPPLASDDVFTVNASERVKASARLAPEGTIDSYLGQRSQALVFTADLRDTPSSGGSASVSTPTLHIENIEADLGRLTVGFDLSVSRLHPVRVLVASLTATGTVTGVIATTVVPPAAGSYYRFTPDLASFENVRGEFDARAPRLRFAFEVSAASDRADTRGELTVKIDNLSYL